MSRSPADESVFHAVACPTRRALLDALAAGEQNVGELVEKLHVTQSAVSNNCAATGPVIDVQVYRVGQRRERPRRIRSGSHPDQVASSSTWAGLHQHRLPLRSRCRAGWWRSTVPGVPLQVSAWPGSRRAYLFSKPATQRNRSSLVIGWISFQPFSRSVT